MSRIMLKPGYYIDWANDIMIVYPDGKVDIYSNMFKEFHTEIGMSISLAEGAVFLGDL